MQRKAAAHVVSRTYCFLRFAWHVPPFQPHSLAASPLNLLPYQRCQAGHWLATKPIGISPHFLDSLGHIGAHFWGGALLCVNVDFDRKCQLWLEHGGKSVRVIGGDPLLGDDFAHLDVFRWLFQNSPCKRWFVPVRKQSHSHYGRPAPVSQGDLHFALVAMPSRCTEPLIPYMFYRINRAWRAQLTACSEERAWKRERSATALHGLRDAKWILPDLVCERGFLQKSELLRSGVRCFS